MPGTTATMLRISASLAARSATFAPGTIQRNTSSTTATVAAQAIANIGGSSSPGSSP